MSRHSRFITAILSVLFALTAIGAMTSSAEEVSEGGGGDAPHVEQSYDEPGGGGGQEDPDPQPQPQQDSQGEGLQGGGDDDDRPQSHADPQPQDDSDHDDDDSGSGRGGYSSSSDDDSIIYYYDSDGHEYSNPSQIYVGGDQTYNPPPSVPATTAALYDTSKSNVDGSTLTSNDWKDIQNRLRDSNSTKNSDSGDFAFIQKNTSTEDNGHWMLVLGFALIILSITGFITLIAGAGRRRKAAVRRSTGTGYVPAKSGSEPRSRYSDDFGSDADDSDTAVVAEVEEPVKPAKTEKRRKGGTRYRK